MDKISIGITTYNRNKLLIRAVKSILKQTNQNFEILIGNDYVKKKITYRDMGIKDKRVKIFNYIKNIGEVNNMNFLLNKSKSKWFTWLADDDYLEKNFLEILQKNIINFKAEKVVASYCNFRRLIEGKKYSDVKILDNSSKPILFDKKSFLLDYSEQKIRLIGVYGLINSQILKKIQKEKKIGKPILINNKSTGVHAYTDFILPIKLNEYGKIVYQDIRLVNLDIRHDAISSRTVDYSSYLSSQYDAINIIFKIVKKLKNNKLEKKIYKNFISKFLYNMIVILERDKKMSFTKEVKLYIKYSLRLILNFNLMTKILFIILILKMFFKHSLKKKLKVFYNMIFYN